MPKSTLNESFFPLETVFLRVFVKPSLGTCWCICQGLCWGSLEPSVRASVDLNYISFMWGHFNATPPFPFVISIITRPWSFKIVNIFPQKMSQLKCCIVRNLNNFSKNEDLCFLKKVDNHNGTNYNGKLIFIQGFIKLYAIPYHTYHSYMATCMKEEFQVVWFCHIKNLNIAYIEVQ